MSNINGCNLAHNVATSSREPSPATADLLSPAITFIDLITPAPFPVIQNPFDYLAHNPATAAALNDTYFLRGIFKAAATINPMCDQKLTIDLSPTRTACIPPGLQAEITIHGLAEILTFFTAVTSRRMLKGMNIIVMGASASVKHQHFKFGGAPQILYICPLGLKLENFDSVTFKALH